MGIGGNRAPRGFAPARPQQLSLPQAMKEPSARLKFGEGGRQIWVQFEK